MKPNYNRWFYKSHEYLTNSGINGVVDYNDTKTINVGDRYKKLEDLSSELFNQQPYGIISNKRGFNKLLDLMEKSNYDFSDIDNALVETYRKSLTNSMSRMLVNTSAIMFKCWNTDKRYVSSDRFSRYYVVEAPFDQLHFGDRDEFIRQQLDKMHTNGNDKFIPLTEFVKSPYTDLLGFTLMCCVNGRISNDCLVAIDDKGFKFKINWPYDYKQCYFVIYKLDASKVYTTTMSYDELYNNKTKIPMNCPNAIGERCIVNMYDMNYSKTVATVPNFGVLTTSGVELSKLQQYTMDEFVRLGTKTISVTVYALKYFHEVPNIYPAVNYEDIVDSRRIYSSNGDGISDGTNDIYGSSTNGVNELEKCTPPIVLDRSTNNSFIIISDCLRLRNNMIDVSNSIKNIGNRVSEGNIDNTSLTYLKSVMLSIQKTMLPCFRTYLEGSLLTSLVDSDRINKFEKFMTNVNNFINNATLDNISQYTDYNVFPELYENGFTTFVDYILKPFEADELKPFRTVVKNTGNYFVVDNANRFNRPVSEQCFITMKYDNEDSCWVFDVPNIEHFKGIGNTFYINDDLKGDEIFKFFVLYTDTENPVELNINALTLNQVFDFDTFYDEVERHLGYVKYWNAENKIMKLCKMIYGKYDEDTSVHVLSKILKRKINGEDIIDMYPTEMNYEPSNASSLNWNNYNEYSDNAPFAVNFLFYTLELMNGNEDQLQSYLYRMIVKSKQSNRYADINVGDGIDRSYMSPINYSILSISPIRVDMDRSSIPQDTGLYTFYGLPFMTDNTGQMITSSPYRYVFNIYENETEYPVIEENDYSFDGHVSYSNIYNYNANSVCYRYDIGACKLLTRYIITCYDMISYIQTNYKIPINMTDNLITYSDNIDSIISQLSNYISKYNNDFINPNTRNVINSIFSDNFSQKLYPILGQISSIRGINYNGRLTTIENVSNEFLKTLQNVYKNTGFDDGVSHRVRNLYLHFKKINETQSVYNFSQWVENIDIEMIQNLDNSRAENENSAIKGNNVFEPFAIAFADYISPTGRNTASKIRVLNNMINNLYSSNYLSLIKPIIDYCEEIIETWIFDFYILDDIIYDKTITYSEKPYVVSVDVTSGTRFHPPVGQIIDVNSTLIFEPIVDNVNGSWVITNISKICEYAFFEGSDLNVSMKVLSQNGDIIRTIDGTMSFFKIGSSADDMVTFAQYPNMKNECIDIQNIHEEFEIDSTDDKDFIVNKKFGKMNYELYLGNNYKQLDHTSELVLEPVTYLPGSIDRIYLPGYLMNRMSNHEFAQHESSGVYFKPVQVLHIPIENNEIESVGGKYFVGQTLWLMNDDESFAFPIIVTAVDMAINNGFVEAVVDSINCKWFNIQDISTIKRYMENAITCTVIDDNISNFLDEYNNSDYTFYQVPKYPNDFNPSDEDNPNAYSMPGDPIFVSTNAPYVYTRLNWIFDDGVKNRYPDDHPQTHNMVYIGSTDSMDNTQNIEIKLINHSFDEMTNPEKYPILREEPNDHFIWDKERAVFDRKYNEYLIESDNIKSTIDEEWEEWKKIENPTKYQWENFKLKISKLESKQQKIESNMKRIYSYLTQLETPTTWYNVRTYEAALVYINNGRAPRNFNSVTRIKNIPYTENIEVFIYDWENHEWVDPNSYTIQINMLDHIKIGEYDNYTTSRIMNSIIIIPNEYFPSSRNILIYFAYDKSNVFDDIELNPKTCDVRFKPLLVIDPTITDYDPYENIFIRKQFDGKETYEFDTYSEIDQFNMNGYLFNRPKINGRNVNTPNIRFIDMIATNNGNDMDYNDFDMYVRLPFKDTTTNEKYLIPSYIANVIQPIDGFIPNQTIKLISISNNSNSSYNGNISSVMFEGYVESDGDNQIVTITKSTLPTSSNGSYTCTVFKDTTYPHTGGIITVNVFPTEQSVVNGNWVNIKNEFAKYKILPNEFVLVPHNPIVGKISFVFKNEYIKNSNSNITQYDSSNDMNPYLYYYNNDKDIKYPIGNVIKNNNNERLVIDTSTNTNIHVGKNTFISICRYSIHKIPKNGIIDMTGYLPSPLSRDHYEFWVNGRYLRDEVKIISPTCVQLINLKSLRNFECVELVDDFNDSILTDQHNVYVDINGKTYSSYRLAKNDNTVYSQDIKYTFNANEQEPLQSYTKPVISNPNNKNIEEDIMKTIVSNEDAPEIPSLNGVDISYLYSQDIGLLEAPNEKILEMFDKVWKYEQTTNPLFPNRHINSNKTITLKSKYSIEDDMYILYATGKIDKSMTLYISNSPSAKIDDTSNTLKIIPFIRNGVFVYVDKQYQGKWLHSTIPNTEPIKIM